jgi:AraC family transcriptional regulator of adaptative response/methylated-DNA-[protein]-cysteine methyltransferase
MQNNNERIERAVLILEKKSPTRGDAITIRYGFHRSTFGECFIAITEKGICSLEFVGRSDKDQAVADIEKQWRHAQIVHDQKATKAYADKIFGGSTKKPRLPVHVKGTDFQIKVWEALLRVPHGAVVSYETLAVSIGKPRAVRAVANAVAHNPVAFLIPCHRVIRKTGALGGYHWGSEKKRAILNWESGKATGIAVSKLSSSH